MPERAPAINYHAELKKAYRAQRRYERAETSWDRAHFGIATFMLSFIALTQAYNTDVAANKEAAEESAPQMILTTEDSAHPTDANFYLGGFDTTGGNSIAQDVGPAINQIVPGDNVAIHTGESIRDPQLLGNTIVDYSEEEGYETISLIGNSMDGITMAEVADYISYNSDLPVKTVVMNESPNGYEGLKPEGQTNLEWLLGFVSSVKDSEYSTYAKYLVTMVQGIPRFTQDENPLTNVNNFFKVSDETWQDIVTGRRSPMWQVTRQAWALKDSNLQATISHLGQLDPKKMRPTFILARTTNPDDDTLVNVDTSTKATEQYLKDAKLDYDIVYVDGVHHTSYNYDKEAYGKAFSNQTVITNKIATEQARYALQNSTIPWLMYGMRNR
jgi:hypothetical protein